MMKLDKDTYEKIIHSKEFKNWFGDWQHPNSKTSKIVDKNGKPLVVYHGSPYKFNEFKYDVNSNSGQVGADYAFWFSDNYKVAQHFSNTYPKSYYDEITEIRNKWNKKSNQEKTKYVENNINKIENLLYDFLIQQEMEKGVSIIKNLIKNKDYNKLTKDLLNIFFFIGRKNIPDHLNFFIIKLLDIDKMFDDKLESEIKKVKDFHDNQSGYIYPCFIYATNIVIRNGEDVGIGYGRIELENNKTDCIILRNADTGSVLADEYAVFNPRRIKIATGENKTYNRKSKNIYEKYIITKFKLFEYNSQIIDDILDKMNTFGKSSLSEYELSVLKNKGDVPFQDHFEHGNFEFIYDETEDYGDEVVVKGTLKYNGEEYGGSFNYNKETIQNFWKFYDEDGIEFEPESDDFYTLDSLMQDIEASFIN